MPVVKKDSNSSSEGARFCKDCKKEIPLVKFRPRCLDCYISKNNNKIKSIEFKD